MISGRQIRIMIADDHEIVRRGVRNLLSVDPNFEICGEAADGDTAVTLAAELRPDVMILDISMQPTDGLDVAKRMREQVPETSILVFTMHQSESMVHDLLAAGVRGYVLKSDADKFLVSAVETISEGRTFFSEQVSRTILDGFLGNDKNAAEEIPLTKRESEIASLLAAGKSNKEIAKVLFISVKTVETHRRAIMQKLEITSIVELVHWAIRTRLIENPLT
jgi:DNA-binding NarL/FixJ family response regulator